MKKIAVVYSSKSGHTKQYADWLKEYSEEKINVVYCKLAVPKGTAKNFLCNEKNCRFELY